MRVLITGGCGFLGHHLVEHIYKNTDWEIIIIDKLTYASYGFKRLENAQILSSGRVKVFTWDLCSKLTPGLLSELGKIDYILHLAADTHVDNSISNPVEFIHNNISSTVNLLEYSRTLKDLKTFLYFSTDEVYGVAHVGTSYKENDSHNPSNPYSASKSASEVICLSYANTYKIPLIITNTVNITGERQCVEKFIPKVIKAVRDDRIIEIHSNSDCSKPGSRFYIHARNVSSAVMYILEHGKLGEKYNITEDVELDNLQLAQKIAKYMGKELKFKLVNFHEDRPGHDLRYDLNGSKLKELGWKPTVPFEESLERTIRWTMENQEWLDI
jgi:dTDP-glucose 4,6-dehydratase